MPKQNRLQILQDAKEKYGIDEHDELRRARWEAFRTQLRSLYDKDTGQGTLCAGQGRVNWKEYTAQSQDLQNKLYENLDILRSGYDFDGYEKHRRVALYPQ